MLANEELYNSIQHRLKKGGTISVSFVLGFIPVITYNRFGKLEKARLNVELQDIENKIYVQQQYFENWLRTTKDYANKIDQVTREWNQQFDNVLEAAKKIKSKLKPDNVEISSFDLGGHAAINVIPSYNDVPLEKKQASPDDLVKLKKKLEVKRKKKVIKLDSSSKPKKKRGSAKKLPQAPVRVP